MKSIFKNKNSSKIEERIQVSGLVRFCKRLQDHCIEWLEYRTSNFSKRKWKFLVVLFVLIASGFCLYIITTSIKDEGYNISRIVKPNNITETGDAKLNIGEAALQYLGIKKFKHYMDSLIRSPTGKPYHDSIMKRHPGLMDSLKLLEQYQNLNNQ